MNKLSASRKSPYVLSAFTGVSKAIAPIGDTAKVVSVNGGGVGPDLAELGDYFWNVIPLVNFEVRVLTPYVVKERGFKNIVLIYVDDPSGEAVQKVLERERAEGGREAGRRLQIPPRRSSSPHRRQSAGGQARCDLHRIVRRAAGADHQAAARQRGRRSNYQLLGVLVADGHGTARGERRACSRRNRWIGPRRAEQRVAKDYKAKTGKDAHRLCGELLQRRDGVRKLAQPLEKSGKPITGENLLEQRQANGTFDLVGGKMSSRQRHRVDADPDQGDRRQRRRKSIVEAGTTSEVARASPVTSAARSTLSSMACSSARSTR